MKAVVQRIQYAEVKVDGKTVGKSEKGFLIFLGVQKGDTQEDADILVRKITNMRIFEDENGKMNLSPKDVGGQFLVVSQFTLCANVSHGNRPDYFDAESPAEAEKLYLYFSDKCRCEGLHVENGEFGEDMKVSLLNDGPVTIILDSQTLKKAGKNK